MAFVMQPLSEAMEYRESDTFEPNLRPIAILTSYLCLAFALTALILRTLYQIRTIPRPSQETRTLSRNHRLQIQIIGILAVTSLAVTWSYMFKFFTLSYRTWARDRGISDAFRENSAQLYWGQWLKETSLFRDAWETVTEESKRFWWSQQILLITTAWSVYLGIEGYRCNVRHLWAFMLLGQIVAISFAMNLFGLAVLFNRASSSEEENSEYPLQSDSKHKGLGPGDDPTPDSKAIGHSISDSLHQSRRTGRFSNASSCTPYGMLFYIPLFINFIAIAMIPYASNTSMFLPALAMPHVLLFLPPYIPTVAPRIGRIFQPSADAASRHYQGIYRFIFLIAVVLHIKATVIVLLDNTPDRHFIQDDVPFRTIRHSLGFSKARMTVANLLDSLNDHPAVSSVGWDVIMCYVSVTMWVVIQRFNILRNLGQGPLFVDEKDRHDVATVKKKITNYHPSEKND